MNFGLDSGLRTRLGKCDLGCRLRLARLHTLDSGNSGTIL